MCKSFIIYTLLVRKEGIAAFHYFFHALEVALFYLARAALRHKLIAHHHVSLGLLDLFLDGFCARFDHCCRIVRHLVTLISLLVLRVVVQLREVGRFIAQVRLILFHCADEVSRLVTPEFSRRNNEASIDASVQVVFCLHRLELIYRHGSSFLDDCLGTGWCAWRWTTQEDVGAVLHTWRGKALRLWFDLSRIHCRLLNI